MGFRFGRDTSDGLIYARTRIGVSGYEGTVLDWLCLDYFALEARSYGRVMESDQMG